MATVPSPLSGTFSGTGESDAVLVRGACNITLKFGGAVATVRLEKSFDGGSTWFTVSKNTVPEDASFTDSVSAVIEEHEGGVLYRWNCSAYTSGAVIYRIGKADGPRREFI